MYDQTTYIQYTHMFAKMQISEHLSTHRQREGDKKRLRDREGEHSVNDYEGKNDPGESRSS